MRCGSRRCVVEVVVDKVVEEVEVIEDVALVVEDDE